MIYIDDRIKKIFLVILVPAIIILIVCLSFYNCSSTERVSPRILRMAQDMVFEVVQDKPVEDKFVYDKELDWDVVPFNERNDKYRSIGTAFAISKTEVITAYHVIDLFEMIEGNYYIRDSKGNVYEIDQITGGSSEKDFVIFTVKDKTFKKYFKFKKNYKIGSPVFSIGNALGEGIIIRSGLILGTVPEGDSGRWNRLKSSAEINPGNSGGPIITPDGKVIALFVSYRGNIAYSTPAEEILNSDRSAFHYRQRFRYIHYLLNGYWFNRIIETQVQLPNNYSSIKQKLNEAYRTHCDSAITDLFEQAPEYPVGSKNILHFNYNSWKRFPEISYIDLNENSWVLSSSNWKSYTLDNNIHLHYDIKSRTVLEGDLIFYNIVNSGKLLMQTINTNPRFIMDTILQKIPIYRDLWYDEYYRVMSYGEPDFIGNYKDAVGRIWITVYWIIGYENKIQIMYILPQPTGPSIIATKQDGVNYNFYDKELQKICDHTFVAYDASYNEWMEILELKEYVPDFIKNHNFEPNKPFRIVSGSHMIEKKE